MPDLADVIEFVDAAGDVLAVKLAGSKEGGIRWGSQLVVREGQVALFMRDGKSMALFEPGRHVLTTQNAPLVSKLAGLAYGGETPFRAEVYYVGTQLFRDLRWGTPEPVYIPDPVLMQIPIRAHGRFAIRVSDPAIFVPKVLGTRPLFRLTDIEDFLRGQYVVSALTDAAASLAKPFAEMPRYFRELGLAVKGVLAPEFASMGLELTDLSVNSVTTTEEIQAMLNGNAQIASEAYARAKGTEYDLSAKASGAAAFARAGTTYKDVAIADAMKTLAEHPSTEGSTGLSQGVNLGLMMTMPQVMGDMLRGKDTPASPEAAADASDPVARIKRLKELLDLGAISQAEFDAKKARLLDQI